MGLFSSSAKSSSNTNAATDSSNVVTGTKNQVGTLNLGEKASYLESGAFSNTGTISSGLANAKITSGANSTITIGETGVAETFANTIKDLFAAKTETATAAAAPAWAGLPGGIDFGNASQGGGMVPEWLKSPWVIGGALLAVVAIVFLKFKR